MSLSIGRAVFTTESAIVAQIDDEIDFIFSSQLVAAGVGPAGTQGALNQQLPVPVTKGARRADGEASTGCTLSVVGVPLAVDTGRSTAALLTGDTIGALPASL